MSSIKRPETKLVPVPSVNKIPERDVDKSPILEAQHLGIDFGGLTAVNEFNMAIGRTEIAGLIGPNGAGKTTVFNLLTKAEKDLRGSINRRVNCDAANLDKAVDAAQGQIEAIYRLEERGMLEELPDKLKEAVDLRVAHPELTLAQLAELCEPPVSKSAFNHRLRKLMEMARA